MSMSTPSLVTGPQSAILVLKTNYFVFAKSAIQLTSDLGPIEKHLINNIISQLID